MEFHLRNVERLLMPTQTTSFIMNTLKGTHNNTGASTSIDGSSSSSSSSIDGSSSNSGTSSSPDRIRIRMLKSLKGLVASPGKTVMRDLASDRWTGGFSGADLEGLVRCAGSIALSRARNDGSGVDGLLITTEDVNQALQEVKQ